MTLCGSTISFCQLFQLQEQGQELFHVQGLNGLVEVRDAVGHANVSITSAYLHVAVEDDVVGRLFA